MERIGKFVVREHGNSISVFRVVGYDFDNKNCIMRPARDFIRYKPKSRADNNDYYSLLQSDTLYSLEEAIELVRKHMETCQNVVRILMALESQQTPRWLEIERRTNYKEEFKHLYPALQNITTTLHYLRGREDTSLYREYMKAFKNIRKRFYFYFGEDGKNAVDNFATVAGIHVDSSLHVCRLSLAMSNKPKHDLLHNLEKYLPKCTPIEHP